MAFENRKYLIVPKTEVTRKDTVFVSTLEVILAHNLGNGPVAENCASKIQVSGGTADVTEHSSWQSFSESLLYSVDGTKTFVKWDGTNPSYLSSILDKEGPYTHSEMTTILSGADWNITL